MQPGAAAAAPGVRRLEQVITDRLRKECSHLGIDPKGLTRTEIINELHNAGLYDIDTRFPAKPPRIDTSDRRDDLSNVFVGNGAGLYERRSNRLVIANNDRECLIGGDFARGEVSIDRVLRLCDSVELFPDTPGVVGDLRRVGSELYMFRAGNDTHPGWYPLQFGPVMIV